jgi:hypothetical protein
MMLFAFGCAALIIVIVVFQIINYFMEEIKKD